jgi:hypothetical protein
MKHERINELLGDLRPRGTYAPYEHTHELVLEDLLPIGMQTKTSMSMYIIIFMSVIFLYYE